MVVVDFPAPTCVGVRVQVLPFGQPETVRVTASRSLPPTGATTRLKVANWPAAMDSAPELSIKVKKESGPEPEPAVNETNSTLRVEAGSVPWPTISKL